MTIHLTPQIAAALQASENHQLELVDPQTNKVFVICDLEMHRKVKAILDRDAIANGIAQMEAGEGQPLDEAFEELRQELKFPKRP